MKKIYKRTLIMLIVLVIIVILVYMLIDFLSKIKFFTGVISGLNNGNIYVDINEPLSYKCPKNLAIVYDKNGNSIDSSTVKINDEISIGSNSINNTMYSGIVTNLDDESITIDTFLPLHYFCITEGAKIKNSNGIEIDISNLHIGDKIRVTFIFNYMYSYDNSIKNIKLIEVLDED